MVFVAEFPGSRVSAATVRSARFTADAVDAEEDAAAEEDVQMS